MITFIQDVESGDDLFQTDKQILTPNRVHYKGKLFKTVSVDFYCDSNPPSQTIWVEEIKD